jgi:hypothetical protein
MLTERQQLFNWRTFKEVGANRWATQAHMMKLVFQVLLQLAV